MPLRNSLCFGCRDYTLRYRGATRFDLRVCLPAIFIPQMGYNGSMKVKTSITLSDELIKAINQYGKTYKNRSDFIEEAIWAFIDQIIRNQQNARDIELINQNADRLNAEAYDVLGYQVPL